MFEQVFFSGLALGSIYGLVALGFAVIFKATDVFNFAQGMFVVCGAYFAVTAMSILQLPFPLAILFIIGAAALLGVLIHMVLIQPLSGRPMLSVIMLTIALSIALRAFIEIVFGHGRNVSACCKSFFTASDNDATYGIVGVKSLQSRAQLVHQGTIQSIQGFGAVERDDANFAAFGADFDVFVGQNFSPNK